MRGELILRVNQNLSAFGYDVYGYTHDGHQTVGMVQPLVVEDHERGMPIKPIGTVDEGACQHLMDDLWAAGFRPTNEPSGEGIKAHLKDMRTLVSKFAEVDL